MKTITIPALKGERIIAEARDIFTGYIDSDFKDWDADEKGIESKEIKLDVFEPQKDFIFSDFFSEDNVMTQEQIIYFVENNKDLLSNFYTFFPFKSKGRFFVAGVYVFSADGLGVSVSRFSDDYVWVAGRRLRVVVPQLETKSLEPSPYDSLLLSHLARIEEKLDRLLEHLGIK